MSQMPLQVLIADDEEGMRFVLTELIGNLGYHVSEADDGLKALNELRNKRFDLAILDINMPGMSGMDVLREARGIDPDLIVLVITAYGTPELALEAMREGAYDYFTKPFEVQELRITIQRALEKKLLLNQIRDLEAKVSGQAHFHEIIGVSDAMTKVFSVMQRVIGNDVPVLITGESGTGKELVSEAIHSRGPRARGPMVKVNCAAIPESLLESELFGHEKGAFTGAVGAHQGRFEQAHGGTLFLDEIGEMPLSLQAKILRAVQEGEIQRVGGVSSVRVDARLITATNKNLAQEVAARRFREDLYFRINVISIELPPLRQRLADLPLLVDTFIREYNRRLGKNVRGVDQKVMDRFLEHPWPGNIRELENVIQRALIMASGAMIQIEDLPPSLCGAAQAASSADREDGRVDFSVPMPRHVENAVEATERRLIAEALRRSRGRQEAADALGISRKSLHNKMQKYGMR